MYLGRGRFDKGVGQEEYHERGTDTEQHGTSAPLHVMVTMPSSVSVVASPLRNTIRSSLTTRRIPGEIALVGNRTRAVDGSITTPCAPVGKAIQGAARWQ